LKRKLPNTDFDYAIVISLHATKLLPAGEGALFLTNSQEWAERFRKWTNFGFDWNRNPISEGTNAKMSEYSCAVALASLDQSHELMSDQAKNLEVARKVTSQFNLSCQPALEKNLISPYWIIDFKSEKMREVVEKRLKEASIDSRKWWGKGCLSLIDKTDHYIFPNTVRLATSSLGLPMHSFLKSSDFLRIEEVLNSIFGRGI
jgi:dTDP-4-amino-4,6-dideoxygalactose transaminase